ncbi:MAG: hypothetical protein K6B14_06095 [Lachnospiraceae bacterium]|nr:hypothetical protein [Lachnospiraceae bacterium]
MSETPEERKARLVTNKKEQILQNYSVYQDSLENSNVLMNHNLSVDQFKAYETGEMDAETRIEFEKRIKEMMLVDEYAREVLKNENAYIKLWQDASAEQANLSIDANRSGIDKMVNDFKGKKKDAAQKRLKGIDTAKNNLKEERENELIEANSITGEIEKEHKEQVDALMAEVNVLLQNGKYAVYDLSGKLDVGRSTVKLQEEMAKKDTSKMTKEELSLYEAAKAQLAVRCEDIFLRYSRLVMKMDERSGGMKKRTGMYELSSDFRKVSVIAKEYATKHPEYTSENLFKDDVQRDACRWTSPIFHAHEATEDQVVEGYKHVKGLHDIADKAVMDIDQVKAKEDFDYVVDRMDEYKAECKKFQENNPPELFSNKPPYAAMLKNNNTLNELYKKGQALLIIGKFAIQSPAMSLYTLEEQKEVYKTLVYITAMNHLCKDLVGSGGASIDRDFKSGKQLDYSAFEGLDIKLKSANDQYGGGPK